MSSESTIIVAPRGAPIDPLLPSCAGYLVQAGHSVFALYDNFDVQGDGFADRQGFLYTQQGKYPLQAIFPAGAATYDKAKRTIDLVGVGAIGTLKVQVSLHVYPIPAAPDTFFWIDFSAVELDTAGKPTNKVIYPKTTLARQMIVAFTGTVSAPA